MKTRYSFYLMLVSIVIFAIYLMVSNNLNQEDLSPVRIKKAADEPVSQVAAGNSPPFKSTIVPGKPDKVVIAERKAKEKLEHLLKDDPRAKKLYSLAEVQKDPVEFYAQVIDQYGNPVEGARVYVSLGGVYGTKGQVTYTDEEGRFLVTGARATSMGARKMEKPGYEFHLSGISFRSHVRDGGNNRVWSEYTPENPFVYHAWKVGEPAWLIHDEYKKVRFKPSITHTIQFDKDGLIEEGQNGGDLLVTINRSLLDVGVNDYFDWSVTITAVDGGLIETNDPFMYEAPEEGYQSVWEKEYSHVRKGHTDKRMFYIKTRNGKIFGRVVMEIWPVSGPNNDVAITFHYWINPNSSRNLYYSSRMRIYPQ